MKCCYYIDMLLLQDGNTALHFAYQYGHTEIVKHLLTNGADISATNKVSDKIYHEFCIIVRCFINSVINVN